MKHLPKFRKAATSDAASASEVYLASRKTFLPYAPLAHSNDSVRRWIAEILIPTGGVTVAEMNDSIIGMMVLSQRGDIGWIDQLYLHPSAVGQGIGSKLIEHAKQELGTRTIHLHTFQANAAARRFYERHGFTPVKFSAGHGNEEQCPDVLYEFNAEAPTIEYLEDRPEFLNAVVRWHRHEWGSLRPEESIETRAQKIQARMGRRSVPTTLIASVGGTPLGSAMLLAHDMDTRPQWTPWLAGVVVAPEHRRRGIGAALTWRAITEARALGFPALYLYTFSTEAWYAQRGWHLIERTQYFGTDVSVMTYDLA